MMNPLKMAEALSQASKMQDELKKKLEQTIAEGSAGGGAVTATVNGQKQLLKVKIDPSAVAGLGAQADVEMLEDLIVAAVNDAGRKAEDTMKAAMQGVLGGLNLPGLE